MDPSKKRKYHLPTNLSEEAHQAVLNLYNLFSDATKVNAIKDTLGVVLWVINEIHGGNQVLIEERNPKEGKEIRTIAIHVLPPSENLSIPSD